MLISVRKVVYLAFDVSRRPAYTALIRAPSAVAPCLPLPYRVFIGRKRIQASGGSPNLGGGDGAGGGAIGGGRKVKRDKITSSPIGVRHSAENGVGHGTVVGDAAAVGGGDGGVNEAGTHAAVGAVVPVLYKRARVSPRLIGKEVSMTRSDDLLLSELVMLLARVGQCWGWAGQRQAAGGGGKDVNLTYRRISRCHVKISLMK